MTRNERWAGLHFNNVGMFQVHFTNFDYFADINFHTVEEAKRYGVSKGFEFSVWTRPQDGEERTCLFVVANRWSALN